MHTLEQQLRGFCHPACEAMPDAARLTNLVRLGGEAADRIAELEAENARLRGLLPQGVSGLSWVNPAPHAAANAVVAPNTRMVQARDCACCFDYPTPPPDCPACKGVGGFSKIAIAF